MAATFTKEKCLAFIETAQDYAASQAACVSVTQREDARLAILDDSELWDVFEAIVAE